LVNNAGYGLVGSVEDISIEEMKAQYETNVFGVLSNKGSAAIYEKAARRLNR